MIMFEKKSIKYFDAWLIILIVLVFGFGLIVLGSALEISSQETLDKVYLKQIFGFLSGLVLMLIVAFFRYEFMKELYIVFYTVNLVLLAIVLAIGTGNGVSRWIPMGPVQFQPSEFAKILIIMFLAKLLDKYHTKVNDFSFIIITATMVFLPTALIMLQPDLSTSIVLIVILASALFVSGLNPKYIGTAVIIALPIIAFVIWDAYQIEPIFLKEYQAMRIQALFNPEQFADKEAYQTMKSIQAIGSGQLNGKGLYQGTISHSYLPEPQTDFIFAVLAEEFGFIGGVSVIGLLLLIIVRILWIAANAPDLFGKLLCTGVATLIGFQTFVNIGVTTGILPNTGIPLPFVSYGLSSLWANMLGIGLVINVGMMRNITTYSRR